MKVTVTLAGLIVLLELCVSENCDQNGILIYEDLACTPNCDNSKNCPSSYSCRGLEKSTTSCTAKGKIYQLRQRPSQNETFCQVGCFCSRSDDHAKFVCAIGECGDRGPKPNDECYWKYSLDRCCPVKISCPPHDASYKCNFEGQQYRDGERFFPEKSCDMCVCQDGWKGKVEEPFCKRRQCDAQFRNQGEIQKSCAPLYTRQDDLENGIMCCPNEWICPDGKEIVEGTATSDKICKFGDKELKVGQSLEKDWKDVVEIKRVSCKCAIPPLLTCTLSKS